MAQAIVSITLSSAVGPLVIIGWKVHATETAMILKTEDGGLHRTVWAKCSAACYLPRNMCVHVTDVLAGIGMV